MRTPFSYLNLKSCENIAHVEISNLKMLFFNYLFTRYVQILPFCSTISCVFFMSRHHKWSWVFCRKFQTIHVIKFWPIKKIKITLSLKQTRKKYFRYRTKYVVLNHVVNCYIWIFNRIQFNNLYEVSRNVALDMIQSMSNLTPENNFE